MRNQLAKELQALYEEHGGLQPEVVVGWAAEHPDSALHKRFDWDDSSAAHSYRLWQARQLIVEVEVIYPDGKPRQVYVSPVESRKKEGYVALVDVMKDRQRRDLFLAQALEEYERLGRKYNDLAELAAVRDAVEEARRKSRRQKAVQSDAGLRG